jgi:hypothetical protein
MIINDKMIIMNNDINNDNMIINRINNEIMIINDKMIYNEINEHNEMIINDNK